MYLNVYINLDYNVCTVCIINHCIISRDRIAVVVQRFEKYKRNNRWHIAVSHATQKMSRDALLQFFSVLSHQSLTSKMVESRIAHSHEYAMKNTLNISSSFIVISRHYSLILIQIEVENEPDAYYIFTMPIIYCGIKNMTTLSKCGTTW